MCPGRQFAKSEMIGGLAVLFSRYDVELLVPEDFESQPDLSGWGMGTMIVADKIPFRIRRRQQ